MRRNKEGSENIVWVHESGEGRKALRLEREGGEVIVALLGSYGYCIGSITVDLPALITQVTSLEYKKGG